LLPAFFDTISLQAKVNVGNADYNLVRMSISQLYVYPDPNSDYSIRLNIRKYNHEILDSLINLYYIETSFDRLELFPNLTEGFKALKFESYLSFDNGLRYIYTFDKFDSVYVSFGSDINYVEGSLAPTAIVNDTAYSFECGINLTGSSTYSLDPFASRLELHFEGGLIAGFLSEAYDLSSGENTISTNQVYIPSDLIGKELTPRLILSGDEYGSPRTDTILFGDETIMVDKKTDIDPSDAEIYVFGETIPVPLVGLGAIFDPFSIVLENPVTGTNDIVGLQSATVVIKDRYGNIISPDEVLSIGESGFYLENQIITQSSIVDNRLKSNFNDYILPNDIGGLLFGFKAVLLDDISLDGFNMSLDSRDIKAKFIAGQYINQIIPVVGDSSEVMLLEVDMVVLESGIENSLMTRNNPFNPNDGPAEIAYELSENTAVDLTIYTLTGEKVYETTFGEGMIGGMMGSNIIIWSGENDEGRLVLNGVYVAVIAPHNTSKTYKLKIAVMK